MLVFREKQIFLKLLSPNSVLQGAALFEASYPTDSWKGKGEPSEGAQARLVGVLFQQGLLKTYPSLSYHHWVLFQWEEQSV